MPSDDLDQRWSQQEQQQAYEAPPPPPADDMDTNRQLGELKTQGVLSEAEFEAQKARILGS